MNFLLKKHLKIILSSSQRQKLKHFWNDFKHQLHPTEKISLEEMRDLLVNQLRIRKGDKMVVSSSFGNLNADFTPEELLLLLMDIVGNEGLIMMPYYPPVNSTEWAKKNMVFDVRTTKSGMGIMTNVFSHMPGVVMSNHPTKAVCAWGNNAKDLVKDHEKSSTPFYCDSPYGKLLMMHSKSLGLGVKNITTMHAIEDILSNPHDYYYQSTSYNLGFIDKDGNEMTINTLVHDEEKMNRCMLPGDYVNLLNCKSYRRIGVGYKYAYVIDNDELFETCKKEFKKGNTRLKK